MESGTSASRRRSALDRMPAKRLKSKPRIAHASATSPSTPPAQGNHREVRSGTAVWAACVTRQPQRRYAGPCCPPAGHAPGAPVNGGSRTTASTVHCARSLGTARRAQAARQPGLRIGPSIGESFVGSACAEYRLQVACRRRVAVMLPTFQAQREGSPADEHSAPLQCDTPPRRRHVADAAAGPVDSPGACHRSCPAGRCQRGCGRRGLTVEPPGRNSLVPPGRPVADRAVGGRGTGAHRVACACDGAGCGPVPAHRLRSRTASLRSARATPALKSLKPLSAAAAPRDPFRLQPAFLQPARTSS